jgi:hypothetical protein
MGALPMTRLLIAAAVTLSWLAPAAAEPPTREWRNTFGAQLNDPGVQDALDLAWTWKLSHSSSPLLSGAQLSLGLTNTLSPAYDRLGAWIELSPLSVLDLRAGFEPTFYFGFFNALQDFPSYGAPFDRRTRREHDDSYSGFARRLFVAPTLKLKLGRVVGVAGVEVEWWKAGGDGPFFYEPGRDTLLRSDGDRVVRFSGALLVELRRGDGRQVLAGPAHQLTQVEGARLNRVQRLGLLGVHDLGQRRLGVAKPQLIAQLGVYLDDPWKDGEPWAQVALRFGLGGR